VNEKEFEDTKGVIWICISKKNLQHNSQRKKEQKDKQRSAKHTYKTSPTKNHKQKISKPYESKLTSP
jgi:hypothetical protein